ncbi:zinc finger protein 276 isoform X2 [Canis lupus familiaris]|uniref:zinc finger protein 276 isoform X2 n=1 Tax=Canis lupus familiaris TaxID=9615 RepID=UPI0018F6C7B5|nr:zinc finger protein 276 isoform X2 [Canis lupus familiaris]XP_038393926.1 zinc finger protein 276 isoform X2 [Canis lupus familiaris]
MWGSSLEGLLHLGSWEDSRAWASPPLGRCSLPRSLCFPCPVQRAASPADLMSLCLPRNRPGSCHGALSPLPWEVLLTESPQHFWQGTWGQFRQTTSRGASFHQGLPASAGGGRPPGPSSVSVRLQELPCPVLPVPWPPQVLPAESQRLPDGPPEDLHKVDLITSSPQGLRDLVAWVHGHAASCGALPNLQRTLSSEYCGVIQAVWGCDQGHDYTMDADSSCGALLLDSALAVKWTWDKEMAPWLTQHRGSNPTGAAPQSSQGRATTAPAETETLPSTDLAQPSSDVNPVGPGLGPPSQPSFPSSGAPGRLGEKQVPSSTSDDRVKDEFSDLSEGDILSEDENDKKQNTQSSDESFEPYPEKKVSGKKSESKEAKKSEEPKIRKKPGPKPGWKNKLRCEREELPTIYKCPYQGCTAVYRGADGMKKHIKEHHEEVRERPCPHPGCNKVFMIDRYLQRHVKLIHTEVRNYICDECGQTFKQRKHLLVHQMRHSGAKPLQCEVCGFQCRQRASLKYHMTKHKAETELDFACDQCGRRFEKAHNLNVHMSMVHPLTQTQDKALTLEPAPGPVEGQAVKPEPT